MMCLRALDLVQTATSHVAGDVCAAVAVYSMWKKLRDDEVLAAEFVRNYGLSLAAITHVAGIEADLLAAMPELDCPEIWDNADPAPMLQTAMATGYAPTLGLYTNNPRMGFQCGSGRSNRTYTLVDESSVVFTQDERLTAVVFCKLQRREHTTCSIVTVVPTAREAVAELPEECRLMMQSGVTAEFERKLLRNVSPPVMTELIAMNILAQFEHDRKCMLMLDRPRYVVVAPRSA